MWAVGFCSYTTHVQNKYRINQDRQECRGTAAQASPERLLSSDPTCVPVDWRSHEYQRQPAATAEELGAEAVQGVCVCGDTLVCEHTPTEQGLVLFSQSS